MKTLLITGASGYIGKHLVKALKTRYNVISLKFDIRDYNGMEKIFNQNKIDLICHQAAISSVSKAKRDFMGTYDVNVNGTINLLRLAKLFNVKRFVFASSSKSYEADKCIYGFTKKINEQQACIFWNMCELETVGLRYFNIYGGEEREDTLIPIFRKNIQNNKPITVYGNGEQQIDFIHIDDVIQANILALETNNSSAFGKTFDVGTGKLTSINNLIEKMSANSCINYIDKHNLPTKPLVANVCETEKVLNFKSTISLEEGIEKND